VDPNPDTRSLNREGAMTHTPNSKPQNRNPKCRYVAHSSLWRLDQNAQPPAHAPPPHAGLFVLEVQVRRGGREGGREEGRERGRERVWVRACVCARVRACA
jgi:hypothetical protein